MSLHYISQSNSKILTTDKFLTKLTTTDHCNYKLSENIQFVKKNPLNFLYIRNYDIKTKFKGRILEGLRASLKLKRLLQSNLSLNHFKNGAKGKPDFGNNTLISIHCKIS